MNLSPAMRAHHRQSFAGRAAAPTLVVATTWLLVLLMGVHPAAAAPDFNPGVGKGDPAECTQTIGPGPIEAAANAMAPGAVLCLRAGIYEEADKRVNLDTSGTATAPKKIKAYPGERAELRGAIFSRASHWVIEGLFIDSSYGVSEPAPGDRINTDQGINWRGGTNIHIDSVEVTNRRPDLNPDFAGTCVYFGGSKPSNVVLENSAIHHCGQLPRSNHEHCIYMSSVNTMTVRNNWVYDCADRSIQLYSDADNSLVIGNLVDSDSQAGINLDGSANNDVIRNNVVDTPNGKTIYGGVGTRGGGNHVVDNCVWDTNVNFVRGVTSVGNILADPQISGRTVLNPACAEKLPADSPFRP